MHLAGRDEAAQIVAQIGDHAGLIDPLHPPQPLGMQHLPPEGEPDAGGALVELLRRQIGVDQRLHAGTGTGRRAQPRGGGAVEPQRQESQRGFEQPVLVAEIMRHEAGRDAGAAGDLRQRRGVEADLGEGIDGGVDELAAAHLFRLAPAGFFLGGASGDGKLRLCIRSRHRPLPLVGWNY